MSLGAKVTWANTAHAVQLAGFWETLWGKEVKSSQAESSGSLVYTMQYAVWKSITISWLLPSLSR